MDNGAKGLKGLEMWAKKVTEGYKDVFVKDMSTSFRDGLAFCAILHHYQPHLIDFESLSKENIFYNNSLAFSTAEKQLGVPALLDAEDMVKFSRPDRLSVITYLSQLHNCFINENKVNKMKAGFKRILNNNTETGPPLKVSTESTKFTPTLRHEVCQACKHRVFLLERLIVGGKLYHRTCFKCHKCNSLLKPGAYIEGDSEGDYECAMCPHDETTSIEAERCNDVGEETAQVTSPLPQKNVLDSTTKQSPLSASVACARNSFLQKNLVSDREGDFNKHTSWQESESSVNDSSSVSVKDKISAFESNQVSSPTYSPTAVSPVLKKENIIAGNHESLSFSSNRTSNLSEDILPSSTDESLSSIDPSESTESLPPLSEASSAQKGETDCDKSSIVESKERTSANIPSITTMQPRYQSLFAKNRSIITPFKLNTTLIKTVNSESKSLPITPLVKSPESTKRLTFNIPHIQPSYLNRTLEVDASKSDDLIDSGFNQTEENFKTQFSASSENNLTAISPSSVSKQSPNLHHSVSFNDSIMSPSQTSRTTKRIDLLHSEKSGLAPKNESVAMSLAQTGELLTQNNDENDLSTSASLEENKSSHLENSHLNTEIKIIPIPRTRKSLIAKSVTTECSASEINLVVQKGDPFNEEAPTEKEKLDISPVSLLNSVTSKTTEDMPETQVPPEITYPGDLNPFGDDDEPSKAETVKDYPDDLNPFGDDEQSESLSKVIHYDESKNPFASDDDDDCSQSPGIPSIMSKANNSFTTSITSMQSPVSDRSSPYGSMRDTLKKRKAPKPPKLSDIFPNNDLVDSQSDTSSMSSLRVSPSPSKKLGSPSPKMRKSKPAPPPPPTPPRQSSRTPAVATTKEMKEKENMKFKSSVSNEKPVDSSLKISPKKKRPAPPVPIPRRREVKKIPLKEIQQEMKEIEEKQEELEKQGKELEVLIRDRDKDQEPTIEEEENIMHLFELVNEKNALFRRQAELMYIKRSQRLEEEQVEIEFQIRCLLEKPQSKKTDDDEVKVDKLTQRLLDVVDQRNEIIESIDKDRKREMEEDATVQEQIEIKNGDLPITAEIKEKSKQKAKKTKHKKDKKKNEGTESIGKNTLKMKKWFS